MKAIVKSILVIIMLLMVGCNNIDNQNKAVENKNTESLVIIDDQEDKDNVDKENIKLNEQENKTDEQANEIDEERNMTNEQVDESDEEVNKPDEEEQDEELQEIISLVKYADSLKFKIKEDAKRGEIIGHRGHLESMVGEVMSYVGEYDTYEKVKFLLCEYYEEELIKRELLAVNLINISGEMGSVSTQSQGGPLRIDPERSTFNFIKNETNLKEVEITFFDETEDPPIKSIYTLKKYDDDKWKIIDLGRFNPQHDVYKLEKHKRIRDWERVHASSTLEGYPIKNLIDGVYNTSWVEGKEDNGVGEWIELIGEEEFVISGIHILNGYAKSGETYINNNRLKKIEIEFSDGTTIIRNLISDEYLIEEAITFEDPIITNKVRITILEVYEGIKYDDTCISKINIYSPAND